MTDQVAILTPDSEHWSEFVERLDGPEGVNWREDEKGKVTWDCDAQTLTKSAAIIRVHFPDIDVERTLEYFRQHGGFCDCEVSLNVDRDKEATA